MAAFPTDVAHRRRWFWSMTLVAFLLTSIVGATLMNALTLSSVPALQERIDVYRSIMSAIRLLLIAAVACFWTKLAQFHVRARGMGPERQGQIMALRWRVVGWLLIIELIVGHNLIGRVVGIVADAVS
ncbi:MAG: hypothetical protein RLN69_06040 [Woeseiaceae bacterium]